MSQPWRVTAGAKTCAKTRETRGGQLVKITYKVVPFVTRRSRLFRETSR